jgi:hypothetical protein
MSETQSGTLIKLKIQAYTRDTFEDRDKAGDPFVAMFNPNKYALKYEIKYDERQAQGTSANAPSFSNMKSQELTLEFFLDGTGVAEGGKQDVQAKADEFLDIAYAFHGTEHRNRYLRIFWSSLVFDCILKTADVQYNLFDLSGKPLRAKITARFTGFVNGELRVKKEDKSSPDLTHMRTVTGKNRLDDMTYGIYRCLDYYIDVARANGLVNFRKLRAGQSLVFPPVKDVKEEKSA